MSPFGWKDLSSLPFHTITLLEEIQISWLPMHGKRRELALTLRANPAVEWFVRHKCPSINGWLDELLTEYQHEPIPTGAELHQLEQAVLGSMEDWIIYVTEPEAYDRLSFNRWDDQELLGLIDFRGKVVIDVGAGTGSQTFRMAPVAQTIYAVEPVGNLRKFIRNRAEQRGLTNVFAVDGELCAIPFQDGFADVLVTGHVFGDHLEAELNEMCRVVKPGGLIILCPGNRDRDDEVHQWLVDRGFNWGRFEEPGPSVGAGWMRKYWMTR